MNQPITHQIQHQLQQQQQPLPPQQHQMHQQQPSAPPIGQPPPPPPIQTFQVNSPVVQMKIGNANIPLMPHIPHSMMMMSHQHQPQMLHSPMQIHLTKQQIDSSYSVIQHQQQPSPNNNTNTNPNANNNNNNNNTNNCNNGSSLLNQQSTQYHLHHSPMGLGQHQQQVQQMKLPLLISSPNPQLLTTVQQSPPQQPFVLTVTQNTSGNLVASASPISSTSSSSFSSSSPSNSSSPLIRANSSNNGIQILSENNIKFIQYNSLIRLFDLNI